MNSLQKIFGISFHEKYFRVTRGLPLENKKSDVVSVDIFNEFMELCASKSHRKNKLDYDVLEIESEQFGNIYQYTHNFAVFGALN